MKHSFLHFIFMICFLVYAAMYSAAQPPSIGGYNVYYGHLHNHTAFSDGTGTPEQAYNYAKNTAHLDFFGLSDHSEMLSGDEYTIIKNAANTYNKDGEFAAFYGFEWSSIFNGHVTVVNTEDYCQYTSTETDNFSELLAWVNASSGIAFFNHPGWSWWAFQEFNYFGDIPSEKFVGMELWNDVDGFNTYYYNDGYFSNDGNKGYFDEALVRGWKIGASGSDDNHEATWGTRTPWRMAVLANNLSRTAITDALTARRFYSTLDMNLLLSLKINGAEMGSTIQGGNINLQISASDNDANDSFTKVVLIKNGVVAETINLTPSLNPVNITRSLTGADNDYFYVKVTQADGDEAISSPVFIEGMENMAPVVEIVNPAGNTEFFIGDPVNIVAVASDQDGTIAKVEFFDGETKIGEDLNSPYECLWTAAQAGIHQLTAKATDNLGTVAISDPVAILVSTVEPPANFTVESRISRGSDDAEQYNKGTVILNDPVLNMVYESKSTGNQTIGLRFGNLDIPKGANITSAHILFTAAQTSSGTSSLSIKGEASDNAATFTTKSKNISSRKKTSANVTWAPEQWTTGSSRPSSDISSIVSEIVNRPGWSPGNAMAFIITGTGTRTAHAYDGSPNSAPLIHIEYTLEKSGIIADNYAFQPEEQAVSVKTVLVYPNPVRTVLNVSTEGIHDVQRIQVYSITGSLAAELKVSQGYGEIQVDCGNLKPGTYLLKVTGLEGSWSARFVKQ